MPAESRAAHAEQSRNRLGALGGTYTFTVTGPQNFQVQVKAGETWTSDYLPLGTYTIVEENAPQGATIVPNPVTLAETASVVAVLATNPVPAGKMSISKAETGDAAPSGTYTFVVTGPQNFQVQVKAGETWTSDYLPLGTYTIVEQNAPQGATIVPNPVTLTEDGQTVAVTATNPFRNFAGSMSISKVETGTSAPSGTTPSS